MHLGIAQTVWTLLGFNIGIELAQLALLFLVVPWILLLSRSAVYGAFRSVFASCAALLALGWLIERTTTLESPTWLPLAWLEAHPLYVLCVIALSAISARMYSGEKIARNLQGSTQSRPMLAQTRRR